MLLYGLRIQTDMQTVDIGDVQSSDCEFQGFKLESNQRIVGIVASTHESYPALFFNLQFKIATII